MLIREYSWRENDDGMENTRRVGRENECSVESLGEGGDRNVAGELVEDIYVQGPEGAIPDFTSIPGCTQAPGNTPLD